MSLPHSHSSRQIRQDWQRAMDTALEAGQVALLEWGAPRRQLYHLPILSAYQQWNASRGDVTQPVMLVGSLDTSWPVPLLLANADQAASEETAGTPPVQQIYGGADQATYLATMTTQAAQHLPAGAFYAVDLPVAMHPLLAPAIQPHAHTAWHTLPLTLLFAAYRHATIADRAIASATRSDPPLPVQSRQPSTVTPAPPDPWLTWSALSMVIAMIVLALVV